VPKTADKENYKQIEIPSGNTHFVTSQGDVKVIFEPGAQGYVPSLPKFGNGA
jgi:hypothetical protein